MGVGEAKTSDFSRQEYGTFRSKVPMFTSKKSDVLAFPGVKTRFMAEKNCKSPNASILRYFGASPVVVASDGLLGPLTTSSGPCKTVLKRAAENIAHCNAPAHFAHLFRYRKTDQTGMANQQIVDCMPKL